MILPKIFKYVGGQTLPFDHSLNVCNYYSPNKYLLLKHCILIDLSTLMSLFKIFKITFTK